MRISAKADYAVRAALTLAAADDPPVKGERIVDGQCIPLNFLENILIDLSQAGLVASQRGPDGGYRLDGDPAVITVADVIRAVDGPLANIGGLRPDQLAYEGTAAPMKDVWVAVRSSLRSVLEQTTLADVADGSLPAAVTEATKDPDAWAWR